MKEAPTVYYNDAFYVFGGSTSGLVELTTIAQLTIATFQWKRVGNIKQSRNGHNVIVIQDSFFVIGGLHKRKMEQCIYNEVTKEMQCVGPKHELELDGYAEYPELFAVESDYCL